MPNWLLPESIADVLPSEARKTEELRRRLLDHFRRYGYELVMPPMLEYVDSLMPFTDQDMDLRMFKLVDQLSGRTMGLRADMTTQVARIDAFSGHAGRSELIGYVKSLSGSLRKMTVIHGEESSSLAFGEALQALKPQAEVVVPQPGQIVEF